MSAVEQLAARGRRRRGVETSSYARQQQEARRALYHCNYCHRDISSAIRIKCAVCQDFDLCLTCFSVGVELSGHRSNHSYRVIDNLGFPLLHPDWGADEELLLLEGIDHYGLGNWLAVSEHVGTKKPDQCQQHYYQTYIEPDSCPLPTIAPELRGVDLAALAASYKEGRQRKRPASSMQQGPDKAPSAAAAASKQQAPGGGKGGSSWPGLDSGLGDVLSGSDAAGGMVKLEGGLEMPSEADRELEQRQQGGAGPGQQATKRSRTAQEPSSAAAALPATVQAGGNQQAGGLGLSLSRGWVAGEEGQQGAAGAGGEGGEEHTRIRGSGPQLDAATGWHAKRQEFDPEWDNDAETAIAEIEFRPDDTPQETAMKLRNMEIYNKRLDERERRREFIVKYGLLNVRRVHGQERKRLPAEKEQYTKLRVFARFQPPGAHEALMSGLFTEGRLRNCIRELQAYRAAGLRTFAEVEEWQQARHKADKAASKAAGASGSAAASSAVDDAFSGSGYKNPSAALHAWRQRRGVGLDLTGLPGVESLSSKERELCTALRLLPAHYLVLKDHLMRQGEAHGYLSRQEVRSAVRLEKGKAVKVYELLMSCGWLPQAPGGAPADSARGGSHDTGASASEDEGEEQQPWQQQQQKQQPAQEQSQQQEAQQGVGTAAGAEAPAA